MRKRELLPQTPNALVFPLVLFFGTSLCLFRSAFICMKECLFSTLRTWRKKIDTTIQTCLGHVDYAATASQLRRVRVVEALVHSNIDSMCLLRF